MPIRTEDIPVFAAAAEHFGLWVLLRDTNAASLGYMGLPGPDGRPAYIPKPIDCKAKTANQDAKPKKTNGLVADPTRVRAAFSKDRLASATKIWQDFCDAFNPYATEPPTRQNPFRVDLNPRSEHYGCLMRFGLYLHADYDLKGLIQADHETIVGTAQHTVGTKTIKEYYSPWFPAFQAFVNPRFKAHDHPVEMIQHGEDDLYADHAEEVIHVISPHGHYFELQNLADVEAWYKFALLGMDVAREQWTRRQAEPDRDWRRTAPPRFQP